MPGHDELAAQKVAEVDTLHGARSEPEVQLEHDALLGVPVVELLQLLEPARDRSVRERLERLAARVGRPDGHDGVTAKLDYVAAETRDHIDEFLEESVDDAVKDLSSLIPMLLEQPVGQLREA